MSSSRDEVGGETPRRTHAYSIEVSWTGNLGQGTRGYSSYSRNHEISAPGKPPLFCSSDPSFRGDSSRYNPEELLVASLSSCHMLWYLHLCADAGIVVTRYSDGARGEMTESANGAGRFTRVTLNPIVHVGDSADLDRALRLHERAHAFCFVANSVNFPVECEAIVRREGGGDG